MLAEGLHRIIMTKRIIENSKRQIASSTHSSCQSCQGKQKHKQKVLGRKSMFSVLSKDALQTCDKEAHLLQQWQFHHMVTTLDIIHRKKKPVPESSISPLGLTNLSFSNRVPTTESIQYKLTDWQSTSLNFMVVQIINTMDAARLNKQTAYYYKICYCLYITIYYYILQDCVYQMKGEDLNREILGK